SVPIEDLGLVLLENQQITFSHGLINQLLANKAVIITCDGKHMPSGLIVPLVGHSLQSRRFQEQLLMSLPLKKLLWKQTVIAKIRNQACHLEEWGADSSKLHYWLRQVKSGDSENHEALAAANYWHHLFFDVIDGFE